MTLSALLGALPAQAALITFDDVVMGETSFGFDGDGDMIDDVIFSTDDPLGFNVIGPGPQQMFIDEPGLEGTSLLDPDLRVDFLNGATGSISFGFALNSSVVAPTVFASFALYDMDDNLLGSATVAGDLFDLGGGLESIFPEGLVSISFNGVAAYGEFNFAADPEFGRYIIDNFEGTFGSTESPVVPEPATALLLGLGATGLAVRRRFFS